MMVSLDFCEIHTQKLCKKINKKISTMVFNVEAGGIFTPSLISGEMNGIAPCDLF